MIFDQFHSEVASDLNVFIVAACYVAFFILMRGFVLWFLEGRELKKRFAAIRSEIEHYDHQHREQSQ